jgi:hypothetical protein
VLTGEERQLMPLAIMLLGGHVGVPALQQWCPRASRRAVADYLRWYRWARRQTLLIVRWTQVGCVWAMDFADAPQPIEGQYRYLLHVRDLASQCHLAAIAVRRATAQVVRDLLEALCATTDAPLVLKVDNGSAFGLALQQWAAANGVCVLYSPPAHPAYNGSIEASIGALALRAQQAAADNGHPAIWTLEDLVTARLDRNAILRRGCGGRRSAAERWAARDPITLAERGRFTRRYRRELRAIIEAHRTHVPTRAQQRLAIVRTLDRLGYVTIQRRAELVHKLPTEKRQILGG